MEKLDIKRIRCQAKLVGTVVTVAGAMIMTLYKGPIMEMIWTKHSHTQTTDAPAAAEDASNRTWFLGSMFLIIATLAWASLFILQVCSSLIVCC
jgi:hypothetical protein